VVVNENLRGQPHNLFIEDAIQETTVVTTGISAEYGRFTGGVVSTLTKSGGNEFTGSFRDSMTNPNWTETPDFPGAAGTTHDYFFSDRGEYRTAARIATDLALVYTTPSFGRVSAFIRGDVLNVFNTNEIVDPSLLNTDVITSRTGGAPTLNASGAVTALNSGLRPFNPFTDTPKECPQGNTPQQCYDMGANWQKGANFGKPNSTGALQVADRSLAPRTYRLSVGFRF